MVAEWFDSTPSSSLKHTPMIKVYFETSGYAEIVATFADEVLYGICLPALEKEAEERGFEFVTESIED